MKKYKKRLLSGLLAMVMLGTSFPTKIVSATETEEPLEPSIRNITVTVGDLGSVAIKDAEEKFYQAEANTTLSLEVEEGSEIHLDAIPMEGAEVESYKLLDSTGILQEITEAEELNQSSMYGVDITVQDDLEVQFTFKERSGNDVLDESDLENGNSVSDSEKELSETVNSDQTKPEKEEEKDFESDKKIEKSEETNTEIETFPFHAGETMIYEKASKGRTVATSSLSVVESGGPLEFSTLTRPALKYVKQDGSGDMENKWRMAYCLEYKKETPDGPMGWDDTGMLNKQIVYCLTYGVRYWGEPAVWKGYRTGDWKADYFVTQTAIHIVNNEFSLDMILPTIADTGIRNMVTKMVSDAKNDTNYAGFDGSMYKGNEYSLLPVSQNTWHQEARNGQLGFATDWYRQDFGSEQYGSCKEYIDNVDATLSNAPAGAEIVWESSKTYAAFKIWIPEEAYQKAQETGLDITATVTGRIPSYMSGWTYLPARPDWQKVTIFEGAAYQAFSKAVKATIQPTTGEIVIQKASSNPDITNGNDCYSLEGAVFEIFNSRNEKVKEVTTDKNGVAKTGALAYGEYMVKEKKAPKGYSLNAIGVKVSLDSKTENVTIKNDPLNDPVTIEITKIDKETGEEGSVQGMASLAGAQFTVKYYDGYYTKDTLPSKATRTWVIETKARLDVNGKTVYRTMLSEDYKVAGDEFYRTSMGNTKPTLPLGTITIEETKAPNGYTLEGSYLRPKNSEEKVEGVYVSQITDSNSGAHLKGGNEFIVADETVKGGVSIEKWDLELDEKNPQGSASLEGAKFAIISRNELPVVVDGKSYENGETVMTIATDAKGIAKTKENTLPYGDYTISELEAPEGYLPEGENLSQNFEIRENGKIVALSKTPAKNQVKRGDFQLVKAEADTYKRMANVKFTITSKTTKESHAFVTDENGFYSTSSSWNPHTQNTNRGESAEDGIWFGKSKPNNEKGALPYDTYTIEEQPCEANKGHELIKFDVVIKRDNVVVDLGTVTDQLVPVAKIFTTASVKEMNRQDTYATEEVTIQDKVSYVNLIPDKTYTVKGILMDKETKKPFLVNGKEVIAQKEFTAKDTNGSVMMEFTFDASGLDGKDLVVFEKLYLGKQLVASHEDLEDSEQTIHFRNPKIQTNASEKETGTKEAYAVEQVTIQDEITYNDLIPGQEYVVKGTLMDKSTGKALLVNGREVNAEKSFTASASKGTIRLAFVFDASGLEGKTVVVFERLYHEGKEIAVHTDINDVKQSVMFVTTQIQTNAADILTESNMAYALPEVTVVDQVTYKNLLSDEEYTIKGILMDKATGKPLLINEKKVTAEKTFVAKKNEGNIEVHFTFDATDLKGKEVVVYEKLFHGSKEIAAHEDLEDKKQRITFCAPSIRTNATDQKSGTHEGTIAKKVTVVDEVMYEGLLVGKEYTVKGRLMDKATGEPLQVKGKEITAEQTFTAEKESGSISLSFTFDASGLDDKQIVAFEKLVYEEREIAVHEDLADEDQTVVYKKEPEKTVTLTSNKPKTTTIGTSKPVKTGDVTQILPYLVLAGGALLVILAVVVRAIKKKKQHVVKRITKKK